MGEMKWEADKMLDMYIYDYFLKRELHASAKAFKAEGEVSSEPLAIDVPGGFLFEWWSIFWDLFIAKYNSKHSVAATSYLEVQLLKAQEEQQQQLQQQQQQQLQQQHQQQLQQQHQQQLQMQQQHQQKLQMQQLMLQRHLQQQQQQQQCNVTHLSNGLPNGLVSNDHLMRHNPGVNAAMKQRFGDNGQLLDQNHTSILMSAGVNGQPSGQLLHGAAGGMTSQTHTQSQQQPCSTADIKSEINPVLNHRATGSEGSLIGIQGSNQSGNNLTLKGWPLTGFDNLGSGLLQQQNPYTQAPQPTFYQHQMLTPQQQQQLLLAQQNLTTPSTSDESRRMRMLMNTLNMGSGNDGLSNSVMDVPIAGPHLQNNGPHMPCGDTDMLIKQQQQQNGTNSQQQHHHQHSFSNQQSQSSKNVHQQDKMVASGSVISDGNMSKSYRGNNQKVSKKPTARKRKQPVSSSGPANSSGTANAAGPSPGSVPSTPTTHTPGDAISMPLAHNSNSSKPMMMFGTDGTGTHTSPSNQLADMECFVDNGSLDENVDSFLSPDDVDQRDALGHCMNVSKGTDFGDDDWTLLR